MISVKRIVWTDEAELHIWVRHRVSINEVEEAAYASKLIVRGRESGIYEVYGRTEAGRYLLAIVRLINGNTAKLITARGMTLAEQRRFKRHIAH